MRRKLTTLWRAETLARVGHRPWGVSSKAAAVCATASYDIRDGEPGRSGPVGRAKTPGGATFP
jgi:hypothetical protein